MAIPISTTTISVTGIRPQSVVDPNAEGYDGPAPTPVVLASNVRATITLPAGRRGTPTDEVVNYVLRCDPFAAELTRHDVVTDELTNKQYQVETVAKSLPEAYGLSHWKATLTLGRGIDVGGPDGVA